MQTCTTCPYCGVGCGINIHHGDQINVKGDVRHPANYGRLCVKGSSLAETLNKPGRLLKPQIGGKDSDWDTATSTVAEGFQHIRKEYGSEAIAFYLSGQLMTEDYYVANKLMKGFLGSGNVDTNSRLCMSSAVVAHKRAFGEDLVPGCYEDFEQAEMIVLVGSNMAYTHPVIFQRISEAKRLNPALFIVVIDPRRTPTCEMADLHLALKPATDSLLFNGLLCHLAQQGKLDTTFIDNHTQGFEQTLSQAQSQVADSSQLARLCDLPERHIEQFFERFANTEKVVTAFSQGINQSGSGSDDANSIINCHLATGRIGKPGACPFSLTGQPNAMGGREVGGMANTFAAHIEFEQPHLLQQIETFWQAENMARKPGLKAVEMMEAVHSGKIKALWIMATNPVVSMPDADFVREALQRCELVVVSDCMADTDTARLADILLPACTWGERTGTVSNSERRISLQRGFLDPAGEAKPDWQIISEVARKMGFNAHFNYRHPSEIFREHAALSGLHNKGSRAFDISSMKAISEQDYLNMRPFQWPNKQARLFADGKFFSANQRASFVPIAARLNAATTTENPLLLNTGRIRDQWHTMTRTGSAPRLLSHIQEPFLHIHPNDADKHNLKNNRLATISSPQGDVIARVLCSEEQRPGEVFMPIHWNDRFSAKARVSSVIPRRTDPHSGQPQYKQTPIKATPLPVQIEASLLMSHEMAEKYAQEQGQPESTYWVKVILEQGVKFLIAETDLERGSAIATDIRQRFPTISSWAMLSNHAETEVRLAGFIQDRLAIALFTASHADDIPDLAAVNYWLGKSVPLEQRFRLLDGQANDFVNKGPIVCSCYQVGQFEIVENILEGAGSVDSLGENLRCGTNCGSCIPELKKLITQNNRAIN